MKPALEQIFTQRTDVWRSRDRGIARSARGPSTGFAPLDEALHGEGWPRGALTELLLAQPGSGELFLLAPLLANLSRQQWLQVWINPPHMPYAPALAQRGIALESLLVVRGETQHHLWACEQALRSSACGAVLYWPARSLRYAELRKLQVAAAAQQASGFLLHDLRAAQQTSPAALRMQLQTLDTQLSLQILKQRGHAAGQSVLLAREPTLQPAQALAAAQSSPRQHKNIETGSRRAPIQPARRTALSLARAVTA